jgi:DNA-binding response OmpR family regulator
MSYDSAAELLAQADETLLTEHPGSACGGPVRILLVEDVVSDALLTRIALDKSGVPYRLQTIRKGNEVLPRIVELGKYNKEQMPELLMLDLGLPGTDGFDILEQLSALPAFVRATPIFILTGHPHFEYVCKIYNLWIPDYITKPCKPQKMRAVLNRVRRESAIH